MYITSLFFFKSALVQQAAIPSDVQTITSPTIVNKKKLTRQLHNVNTANNFRMHIAHENIYFRLSSRKGTASKEKL